MENNQDFNFTYSAQQQKEVEAIRSKYLPQEEDKMERLRRLHRIPSQKAQCAALTIGILGALILGSGMSLIMTDIGTALGLTNVILPGIMIGLVGIVMVMLAYPIYNRVLKKNREKIAPEILRLTDELLK